MNVMAAYARNDLRNIRRDTLLAGVTFGPILYALMMWLLPSISDMLAERYGFDLLPYYPVLITAFLLLGPIAVLGAVCGLMLLDDKDQRTLSALRVTPAPPMSYPLYRAAMISVLSTVSVVVSLAISRLVTAEQLLHSIPAAVVCGLLTAVVGIGMARFANNKVEGLAVFRACGMLILGLPSVPWFFDSLALDLSFGVLPFFWPVKAFWAMMDGGFYWHYVFIGAAYAVLLLALLLRGFRTLRVL
ncbi:MAG: ABC transporter permease [Stackebrandtia sp.]